MQKKVLLSSILVIALCLSVIAGSTYALFTDKAQTSIAITSGDVEVDAKLDITGVWSAKARDNQTADQEDLFLIDENGYKYDHVDPNKGQWVFTNGGFAELTNSNSKIEITNITPGDKVGAQIIVKNTGDVEMIYRYKIVANDRGLASGMVITADGKAYEGAELYVSAWSAVAPADDTIVYTHDIYLELPVYAGNEYQSEDDVNAEYPGEKGVTYTITVEAVQGNAKTFNDASVNVAVDTVVDASGDTKTAKDTVISTNGFSADIPAGTTLNGGATTATLEVEAAPADTANFNFAATGAETIGLNISVPEVAADNATPITVTLEAILDKNLTGVMLYHKGVPMTLVASAAEVDADGEFFYDAATGDVTLATVGFSNFTVVVLNNVEVATEAALIAAVNEGKNVVLTNDITLTKTLLIKKNVAIDLNGYTLNANMSADKLLQSSSDTDPDVLITSSKSGAKIDAGDKSVILGYGRTSIYNVEINVGEIKSSSYTTFNVYNDLTLGEGTVVNVGYLGTALINNNGAIKIVIDGAQINVGEFKVSGGAMISVNNSTTVQLSDTAVNVGLNTTYASYFISQENKATISGCEFNVRGTDDVNYTVSETGKQWVAN